MKKLLCCIFVILLLSGCKNKLECVVVEETQDYSITETIIFKFDTKGNEIKKGKYILKMDVSDDYIDYLDRFKSSIILEYTNLYDIGVEREISSKRNTLKFEFNYNSVNYTQSDKEKLVSHGLYAFGNNEQVKNELKKDGYTCK